MFSIVFLWKRGVRPTERIQLLSKEKKILGVDDVLKKDGGGSSVRVIYDNFYISYDYEDAV
jgi:hypothetical protein